MSQFTSLTSTPGVVLVYHAESSALSLTRVKIDYRTLELFIRSRAGVQDNVDDLHSLFLGHRDFVRVGKGRSSSLSALGQLLMPTYSGDVERMGEDMNDEIQTYAVHPVQ